MEPLNTASVGKKQEIKWIIGSREETAAIRNIGLTEGAFVTVMNNFCGGVIVAVNNLRYAVGNDLAYRIKVG